ncbi:MAG TPA: hypothetical protein VMQ17_24080 [Candidatus Sulfotelmatobacter sp.]|nr:hypothetical protein [Candidatus Sulfotelmatobacter sp.]
MTPLGCVILPQFATTFALSQVGQRSEPLTRALKQPEAVVRCLYSEVVARHPIGIPEGADMKVFAPYLSKALLHRIDIAVACAADYDRQYPDPNLKPPFAWLEAGLFSGDDEQASPQGFDIERTQSEKDGCFRVCVRLTRGRPSERGFGKLRQSSCGKTATLSGMTYLSGTTSRES